MAPVSKSGTIRQSLGLIRARFAANVKTATVLVKQADPTSLDGWQRYSDDIEESKERITNNIESVMQKDQRWQDLIIDLPADEVAAEEQLYANIAADTQTQAGYLAEVEFAKELICQLNRKLLSVNRRVTALTTAAPAPNPPPPNQEASTNSNSSSVQRNTAKLPKLTLPFFYGDYLEWENSWSIFSTNVDSHSISDAEKFAYLRGQLKGVTTTSVDGLIVNDANYAVAVKLLKERFERTKPQLISALYSQLKKLSPAANKLSELVSTHDSCEKIFRQLENAGEDVNANRSLVLEVLGKYPGQIITDLLRHHNTGCHSTLNEVRSSLRLLIKQTEDLASVMNDLNISSEKDSNRSSRSSSDAQKPTDDGSKSKTSAFAASASVTTVNPPQATPASSGNTPQKPCYFCDGSHFNSQCDKYRTAVDRQNRLNEIKRCLRCMSRSHLQSTCSVVDAKIRCFFCKSTGAHVSPLCPVQFTSSKGAVAAKGSPSDHAFLSSMGQSVLPTACSMAANPDVPGNTTKVRILFDTGNNRSYVTSTCASRLGLVGSTTETTDVSVFGTKRTVSFSSEVVSINIRQTDATYRQLPVYTIPTITSSPIPATTLSDEDVQVIRSLHTELADDREGSYGEIDILVGSDYFWEFVAGSKVIAPSGLFFIPSTLGLLVCGHDGTNDTVNMMQSTLLCITETFSQAPLTSGLVAVKSPRVPQYPDVDEFWSLETIGISDDPTVKDDDEAIRQFNSSVFFDGERYQVQWPWKPSVNNLPSNHDLALRRFRTLAKRLQTTEPTLLSKYQAIIEDQLAKGVIEPVDKIVHLPVTPTVTHYLPHHPIIKLSSETTKVRIVYDASAKSSKDNPSLNECLYRGPVLLPDLCSILIRFCCHPIGILADVEKAFLQVGLQPSDRDATRFLWFKDITKPPTDDNIEVYRFCRVLFGIISSPFLLGATIQYHLNQQKDCIADDLKDNTYVDNAISGSSDDDRAILYQQRAKQLFKEGGMNLQQWCSNSQALMKSIPDTDKVKKTTVKVLGLSWCSVDDVLQLSSPGQSVFAGGASTKREVLHCLASVFDPLGWFQPAILPAKLLLQRLWVNKHGWDDELPPQLQAEAVSILSDLQQLFDIRIPRHPFPSTSMLFSVGAFSDASGAAYAAAIYLRQHNVHTGEIVTRLFFSKCRLAPKNPSTITLPRLELLGAVIAVRAALFVRNSIATISSDRPIRIYMFTDSQCVLHWLTTPKPLSVFVTNRISEMRQATDIEYLYVASSDNPADLSSRGMPVHDIKTSRLWWHGPEWLSHDKDQWPEYDIHSTTSEDIHDAISAELKKSSPISQSVLAAEALVDRVQMIPFGMEVQNYSSFRKLLRVTILCLKFVKHIIWSQLNEDLMGRFPMLQRIFDEVQSPPSSVYRSEFVIVKILWLRSVQQCDYGDVVQRAQRGQHHSLIKQLNLKLDEWGLLRCHGRLEHIDLPSSAAQPVLLPSKNPLTTLFIRELHGKLFHSGIGHTLGQARREFWMPKGRSTVRSVFTKCVVCRKHKGASFALPNMPPWPRERLSRSNPFQYTGLDYLGPINVKIGNEVKKVWVCLLTCLAVRAIHLEYVMDCSAKQFLDCMIRFVSRRGTPEQIISDSAPQFRTVKTTFDKMWHSVMKDDSVLSYAAETGILWKFTTELAPWQGGFYERLVVVGIVKRALKVVVGRRLLEFSEFITLCAEVEAVVNSRPITYVYGDFASRFALRPADFLTELPVGMPSTGIDLNVKQMGEAGGNVVRYWKSKKGRLDALWTFWQDEYLLSLRERSQTSHKGKRGEVCCSPHVGQIVLLKDTNLPCGAWKLARVDKLIPSADNTVRSVELMLPNRCVIRRAVNFIYPLEIDSPPTGTTHQPRENGDDSDFDGFDEEEVQDAVARVEQFAERRQHTTENIRHGLSTVAMVLAFGSK